MSPGCQRMSVRPRVPTDIRQQRSCAICPFFRVELVDPGHVRGEFWIGDLRSRAESVLHSFDEAVHVQRSRQAAGFGKLQRLENVEQA